MSGFGHSFPESGHSRCSEGSGEILQPFINKQIKDENVCLARVLLSMKKPMDIVRPDRARRLRRWMMGILAIVAVAGMTFALSRLEPALPSVDRDAVLTGSVEFWEMVREVRGNGSLVPEHVLVVPAEVPGRVVNIFVLPGAAVESETPLVELSNPALEQEEFEITWQLKGAEAQLQELLAKLEQDRLMKEALVAKLKSDWQVAKLEAAADAKLAADGLVPILTMQRTKAKAENLADQVALEERQLVTRGQMVKAQLAAQESEIGRLEAALERKRKERGSLLVRAGTSGVVKQIGSVQKQTLQLGEQVPAGEVLAKVVRPSQLMAQIRIAETQARDVQLGLPVEVDTRNGVIPGRVSRVDPAVVAGTVTVDVKLEGALPKGARPDLSVDGTIRLDHLRDTLYMPRPVSAQSDSQVGLFKLINGGKHAVRVPVALGKTSVRAVQVLSGLSKGDEVILSDMERYADADKIRLR